MMSGKDQASGYVMDTHTVLWAMDRPEVLSEPCRRAILAGPNYLSVISYWEVTIKSMRGTLDVGDPRVWWQEAIEKLVAAPLALRPNHVSTLRGLPFIHKDPFDRILIAQCSAEGLTLVSADGEIAKYSQSGLRIVM
jgi:PIN domain nuclease of toxin-antitoxin system